MEPNTIQDPWQQFYASGSIKDYLAYRQSAAAEESQNEVIHKRIDYSGTSRGGERPSGYGSHS